MATRARQNGIDLGLWVLVSIFLAGVTYAAFSINKHFHTRKFEISKGNLLRIGLVCKSYANTNEKEYWPPPSSRPRPLSFDASLLDPEFADAGHLNSPALPAHERPFGGRSYYYLGYAIQDEDTGLALINALRELDVDTIEPFSPVETKSGDVLPLREGIERMMVYEKMMEEAKRKGPNAIREECGALGMSEMPVMIEHPDLFGDGGHVLYLDGHVEFVPYPGKFPMTKKFIAALESMESVGR